jgi:hypothetical protein
MELCAEILSCGMRLIKNVLRSSVAAPVTVEKGVRISSAAVYLYF